MLDKIKVNNSEVIRVDDTLSVDNKNLVNNESIFKYFNYNYKLSIVETEPKVGWQSLPRPLSGLLYVVANKSIRLSTEESGSSFTIKQHTNQNGVLIYLNRIHNYYYNDTQTSDFEVDIYNISEKDIIGFPNNYNTQYITNWVGGYFLNNKFNPLSGNTDWIFGTIDAEIGKYYLIPYANTESVQSLVNLNDNGEFVSINTPIIPSGNIPSNLSVVNTFAIVKAETSKLGITYYLKCSFSGSALVNLSWLCKYPYIKLDDNNCINPYSFTFTMMNNNTLENEPQIQNIMSMFDFDLTEVKDLSGGYYSKSEYYETEAYGGWRVAEFDVDPNYYYLVNCAIHSNVRIYDINSNNERTINQSFHRLYYNIASFTGTSWALVKPKYNKLGVNVIDPETQTAYSDTYQYPKYVKLDRVKNNGLAMIFLQQYITNKKTYIVRKSGGADYTSLTRAIMDSMGIWGVTIYVDEGEYDLLAELTDYYVTSDFLSRTPVGRGIELGYDITIKASPKALIKSHYTGNNTNMLISYSPFNCYNAPNVGGFSLIGVRIECSRCRYVIHDEKGTEGVGSYNNLYDNCNFKIDNTNNGSWNASQCIGGGLGHSGNIIIRNCIFESVNPNYSGAVVSYHNNKISGAKSFISCTGNYLIGDRGFRFSWYGYSTEITDIILQGNNVGRATESGPETDPDSPYGPSLIENISIKEWNTTLRSN